MLYASLNNCRLNESNFTNANLANADLSAATFTNANLKRTNLSNANLQDTHLYNTILTDCKCDENIILFSNLGHSSMKAVTYNVNRDQVTYQSDSVNPKPVPLKIFLTIDKVITTFYSLSNLGQAFSSITKHFSRFCVLYKKTTLQIRSEQASKSFSI